MPQMNVDENGEASDASVPYEDLPDRPKAGKDAEDEDSEEEEGNEEEYIVEAIVDHKGKGLSVRYLVKWAGYDEKDNTMEPMDNLLPDARDALSAYHEKIGYDPSLMASKGVKRAKSMGDLKKDSTSPAPKRSKANDSGDDEGGWFPKTTNWESAVDQIDHIDRDGKTGSLTAFIRWKDKTKPNTRVSMSRIYTHCPIAMLKFYELHLKFTESS